MRKNTILISLKIAIFLLVAGGVGLGGELWERFYKLESQLLSQKPGTPSNEQTHETVPIKLKGRIIYTTEENANLDGNLNFWWLAIFVAEILLVATYVAVHRLHVKIEQNQIKSK